MKLLSIVLVASNLYYILACEIENPTEPEKGWGDSFLGGLKGLGKKSYNYFHSYGDTASSNEPDLNSFSDQQEEGRRNSTFGGFGVNFEGNTSTTSSSFVRRDALPISVETNSSGGSEESDTNSDGFCSEEEFDEIETEQCPISLVKAAHQKTKLKEKKCGGFWMICGVIATLLILPIPLIYYYVVVRRRQTVSLA